jgi:hypothetical protein
LDGLGISLKRINFNEGNVLKKSEKKMVEIESKILSFSDE